MKHSLLLFAIVGVSSAAWLGLSKTRADDLPATNQPGFSFNGAPLGETTVPTIADPAAEQEKKPLYTLQYKFQPGETLRYEVADLATSETTVAGATQRAEMVTKSVKVWQVTESTPDGSVTFVHSVESVKMRTKLLGRAEVGWDSASGEKPPAGYEDAAKSVGVPLVAVTIDASGKILKRENVKRDNQLGEKIANNKANQMVVPLPPEPVAVGAEWNVPGEVDVMLEGGIPQKVKTRQHFELKSVKGNLAEIAVQSQVLSPINSPKLQAQLIQQTAKGTIQFDLAAGRVVSQQLDHDEQVLGFAGPDSTMKYLAQFKEKLVPAGEKTAKKATPVLE